MSGRRPPSGQRRLFFCGSFLLLTSSWRARQNLFARQSAMGGCTLVVRAGDVRAKAFVSC